ncbi:MAG: hypothetical protein AB7F59_14545 [Bdellovibrionales bacterium]
MKTSTIYTAIVILSQWLSSASAVADVNPTENCQQKNFVELKGDYSEIPNGTIMTVGNDIRLNNSKKAKVPMAIQECFSGTQGATICTSINYSQTYSATLKLIENKPEWNNVPVVIKKGSKVLYQHVVVERIGPDAHFIKYWINGIQFALEADWPSYDYGVRDQTKDFLSRLLSTGVLSSVCLPSVVEVK